MCVFWSTIYVFCPIMRWWGLPNPDSNLRQRLFHSQTWGACTYSLIPTMRYVCQWKEMISYTDYSTIDTHTTDIERSTDNWVISSSAYETLSYLDCDTREMVPNWQNTLIIDHYMVAQESATKRDPNTYIFHFQFFLRITKSQVWTKSSIMKDTKILDRNLIPYWDDILYMYNIN